MDPSESYQSSPSGLISKHTTGGGVGCLLGDPVVVSLAGGTVGFGVGDLVGCFKNIITRNVSFK